MAGTDPLRKTSPSGPVRADAASELTPAAVGGTDPTFDVTIRAAGFAKPVQWLMAIGLQTDTEEVRRTLKQRVESLPGRFDDVPRPE